MIMKVAAHTAECSFTLLATSAGRGHFLQPSDASCGAGRVQML